MRGPQDARGVTPINARYIPRVIELHHCFVVECACLDRSVNTVRFQLRSGTYVLGVERFAGPGSIM